ncbi:unnamed protein product [Rotaria sp. Silwood2]|nr:unnamed protein product [Rotaria sp. Silwood2]CAF3409192.1 unnamed protein product [Rotaria sp. Silwood2]CAF4101117.1 unnamed protein product [Rotaria sp. Silwood2]CAF4377128.1 unnamed protein product [Rotaria sp. Silwood2]
MDDYRGFDINLSSYIYSEYIQIPTSKLNNTAIEIIMQSVYYVGVIHLVCSPKEKIDISTRSYLIIRSKNKFQ